MKALWKQMKFQRDLVLVGALAMIGLFVFGSVLHDILVVSGDEVDSVFCMGSFMATIVVALIMFFFAGTHMAQTFHYAVALGQTRKRTYPMYVIAAFGTFLVLVLLLKLLSVFEIWRLHVMYPGIEIESFVDVVLQLPYVLAFALVGTAVSVFFGATLSRFGKAAFWIWWVLYMILCIGVPRLIPLLTHNPAANQVVIFLNQAIEHIAAHARIYGAAAVLCVTVVFTAAGYLVVWKQEVRP